MPPVARKGNAMTGRGWLVALLLLASAGGALAQSSERAALSSARKRGYTAEQTRCFVPIFVQYAVRSRTGRWIAGSRGKKGDIYRHEVYSRCGVMR